MLQIGITGGIGAGKSLVARIFGILSAPVYNADERAKWLMSHEKELQQKIIDAFGTESYEKGSLNRQYLAEKVFPNPALLKQLNSIVHPAVGSDYKKWISSREKEGYSYTIKEAALIFETGSYQQLDYIILVHASEKTRLKRVLSRDPQRDKNQVREIMKKQMPEDQKLKKADFVIENEGKKMVIPQVLEIDKKIINLAKNQVNP